MKRFAFLSGMLLIIILLFGSIFSIAEEKTESTDPFIYLHIGSPLILSQGNIMPLDPTNLDVSATVINSRTLVPIRALSEYFGAGVSYDSKERKAIIDYQGKRYSFPINEKKYIQINGKNEKIVTMDSKSLILNNRTMVPLRVICEDILGKKVSYQDHVIAIGDKEIDLSHDQKLLKDIKTRIGSAVKAGSMKELEKVFSTVTGERFVTMHSAEIESKAAPLDGAGAQPAPAKQESVTAGSNSSTSDTSYSTTNTQVAGIDEADVVKTDGKYLYLAGNNTVRIVGTDGGKLSDAASIRLSDDKYVQEIYVEGDRLVVLGNKTVRTYYAPVDGVRPQDNSTDLVKIMPPYIPSKSFAFLDVYDISNPERPIYLKGHEMEGNYQSSRKNGDVIYMITNTYVYGDILLPQMRDTVTSRQPFDIAIDDIMIMPGCITPGYVIVSAVNIDDKEKTMVEAITASGYIVYMNDSALYLASNDYSGSTAITKFHVDGMNIGYAGTGSIKGDLLNQFSMDEYQGYLRVAATDWNNMNSLYILDQSLNVYGSVTDLAKGERIYSVRFMGDKGYVVTFRNIDPLFVFDLSNPKNPRLTGELKVPGFSNYLHPVAENLILGIGVDTYDIYRKDENGKDIVIGSRQGGIKFTLFDVSDMGKPRELSTYVVGSTGSYTEAFYNHKAVMFDPEKSTFALDASIINEEKGYEYKQSAVIMNYDKNQLKLKGILDSSSQENYGKYIPFGRRILYIDDELYYIQGGMISSYNYNNLEPIDSIVLH